MNQLRRITALIIVLFVFACCRLYAQDSVRVSLSLQNEKFSRFISILESTTPLHFYYDSTKTDSLRVSVIGDKITINQALETALANSNFSFAITPNDQVFIFDKKPYCHYTLNS